MKAFAILSCFLSLALAAPAFNGQNKGIGSWFRTNNPADSTNGRSWCEYNYEDSWLGFAPSVGTMLSSSGGLDAARKDFCGKKIWAYDPATGKGATLTLVDGFDDAWVLSPGSIDLTPAAFKALKGYWPSDKNDVIHDLQWSWV